MKTKTSELTGAALDWAVAKCEEPIGGYKAWVQADFNKGIPVAGIRADDWLTAGPIIARERIGLMPSGTAYYQRDGGTYYSYGPTPLIAAMRCLVTLKLGNEVEVPDELQTLP